MIWKHDDDLLPDHPSFRIVDVVHFVKYDKLDVADNIGSPVEHTSQDLGRHDQATSLRVDLNISCQDTDLVKGLPEVAELLVAQGLDR